MLVNSFIFCVFIISFIIPYFILFKNNVKAQNAWLLFASYFFYGWADLRMIPLLLIVTIIFYILGIHIKKQSDKGNRKKSNNLTFLGILSGVAILLYFKYLNFFIEQIADLLSLFNIKTNFSSFNIIVPIGVSFFIFKLIGYIIEINNKSIKPTKDFITFATYVAFFPTIMSGPIDKACDFIPQLYNKRKIRFDYIIEGCKRILWGMFLKMCIADKISPYTDAVFNNYYNHSGITLIIAAMLYSFQIYADFCGYSEMAIGVGRILGIKVTENFSRPIFASNISDFWRRWHMTLMTWLRDYIYFQLGGSRCSSIKVFRNTLVTFLISGLWHGANWTFVIWGGYHGVLVYLYRKVKKFNSKFSYSKTIWFKYFSIIFVFILCTIGWIIFRANSIEHFIGFISRLTTSGAFFFSWALTAIIPIFILVFKELKDEEQWNLHFLHSKNITTQAFFFGMLIVYIFYTGELEGAKFIYFQF